MKTCRVGFCNKEAKYHLISVGRKNVGCRIHYCYQHYCNLKKHFHKGKWKKDCITTHKKNCDFCKTLELTQCKLLMKWDYSKFELNLCRECSEKLYTFLYRKKGVPYGTR